MAAPASTRAVSRVLAGPANVDGEVARWVERSDGTGAVERWVKGSGWVTEPLPPGGIGPTDCVTKPPASPALLAELGVTG